MLLDGATIFHVNVNCVDLERSLQFYRDGLGLSEATRTAPLAVQNGTAFGLDAALWDAWILVGDRGFSGGAVDLLQWIQPEPVDSPPRSLCETGWQRIGVMVPDIHAASAAAVRHGGVAWSEPFDTGDTEGAGSLQLCFVSDPDGTTVELINAGIGPRLAFIGMTCANLERSVSFYTQLGFRETLRVDASRPTGDHLRIAGPVAMHEVLMAAPSGDVALLLAGFTVPSGRIVEPRPANAVGMWRVAMLIDDLDAAYAGLELANIPILSAPVSMLMGPGLPELRFVCFRGPDGEVVELIERPAG
jgi:catechol 2,3-dioxygenase-like lactoylglutathione lyase family enzyme